MHNDNDNNNDNDNDNHDTNNNTIVLLVMSQVPFRPAFSAARRATALRPPAGGETGDSKQEVCRL